MSKIIALLLFALPTKLCRILPFIRSKVGKNTKIGFSLIISDNLSIANDVRIGHFNLIKVHQLTIGNSVSIGHLNRIQGDLIVELGDNSSITNQNKITSPHFNIHKSKLTLHEYARIGVGHIFDLTHNITIGKGSTFAGIGTQVWTHSFYFSKSSLKRCRVDKPVVVGNFCNIGSKSIICPGVKIGDSVTLGAGACASKDLIEPGLYVNSSLRKIDNFNPDEIINNCDATEFVLDDYHIRHD